MIKEYVFIFVPLIDEKKLIQQYIGGLGDLVMLLQYYRGCGDTCL